ncbi:antiviral reverse transcriptase Drt3a [Leclercia sp. CFBP8987]|uniref:antiviral reverse transcriptase Drt3a n=1 Tax=Leclercia sp. CFBP8987 TaxID=3096525 RepID=UPI002A6AB912|nr:antiviral reverse transcriptase Drt3a [Leclercia sp. CFBP8987]MDY0923726.1 antiviral reverse transcriptase Drt3a [Leclercia sp. CFBP8987]
MNRQSFNVKNLKEIENSRSRKSRSLRLKPRIKTIEDIADSITSKSFTLNSFSSYAENGKKIFTTSSVDDEIVLSKLNYNIKHIYNIRQSDRHTIIKQVISLLKEECPKYIYKFDIKDFYESIDLSLCCRAVLEDNLLSFDSIFILKEYIQKVESANVIGIPRGIGLSSTLSELAMRPFDNIINKNPTIYYYTRFVDDILIFSTERIDIKKNIIKNLPIGLQLNWKKNKILSILPCKCHEQCSCVVNKCCCWDKCKCKNTDSKNHSFDFLGYQFQFPNLSLKNSSKQLKVDISLKKMNKLKNRIYLSFDDYHQKGNFKLLESRIKFLTGNHYISNGKHHTDRMKSGSYYNYIHLTDLEKYQRLDAFLLKILYKKISTSIVLNRTHREILSKYSFVAGFKNKYTHKFNGNQINKIKGCW